MAEVREDVEKDLYTVLKALTQHSGLRGKVEVKKTDQGYYANIKTRGSDGILIGKQGETLKAIHYLCKIILKRKYRDLPKILVDVGGYKMRRVNFLKKKAFAIAKIVLENRREMALDLLTEKELKFVREALNSVEGIKIYTIGSGYRKNVIIAPK